MHAAGSEEDVFNEWSAARAEMALLRHRAYSADDSIQILEMNVTGLEASNAQFERSLPRVEAEVARLQAEVRDLEERCRWQSIPVPRMEPVRLRAEEELLAFFRRTSLRKDDADGNR
jgi:chromosome segregation ATPase